MQKFVHFIQVTAKIKNQSIYYFGHQSQSPNPLRVTECKKAMKNVFASCNNKERVPSPRAETRTLIGGGGDVYIHILINLNLILKEIRRAEHEDMNIHRPASSFASV